MTHLNYILNLMQSGRGNTTLCFYCVQPLHTTSSSKREISRYVNCRLQYLHLATTVWNKPWLKYGRGSITLSLTPLLSALLHKGHLCSCIGVDCWHWKSTFKTQNDPIWPVPRDAGLVIQSIFKTF